MSASVNKLGIAGYGWIPIPALNDGCTPKLKLLNALKNAFWCGGYINMLWNDDNVLRLPRENLLLHAAERETVSYTSCFCYTWVQQQQQVSDNAALFTGMCVRVCMYVCTCLCVCVLSVFVRTTLSFRIWKWGHFWTVKADTGLLRSIPLYTQYIINIFTET